MSITFLSDLTYLENPIKTSKRDNNTISIYIIYIYRSYILILYFNIINIPYNNTPLEHDHSRGGLGIVWVLGSVILLSSNLYLSVLTLFSLGGMLQVLQVLSLTDPQVEQDR